MPALPQPPDHLGDDLIELREIAEWDIPEVLIAHQDDLALHHRLGMKGPPTGAQLGSEVEHALTARLAGEALKLTIVESGHNDCVGRVEVDGCDWERGVAGLRVWVAPTLRGRGYEQRAADLTVLWLCTATGLRHVEVSLLT